jgi:hypothetical protein
MNVDGSLASRQAAAAADFVSGENSTFDGRTFADTHAEARSENMQALQRCVEGLTTRAAGYPSGGLQVYPSLVALLTYCLRGQVGVELRRESEGTRRGGRVRVVVVLLRVGCSGRRRRRRRGRAVGGWRLPAPGANSPPSLSSRLLPVSNCRIRNRIRKPNSTASFGTRT